MPRSSLVTPGSAICVNCAPVRLFEVSASVTIGKSLGSKRLRIGSSISSGSSLRISEILSRISWTASAGSLPNSNSAMITPKLSSDCESIFFSPLMLEMPSSIGSIRSRSTWSGEAPGNGSATDTTGGAISGNSSTSSWYSAKVPKTTSASIETTVTMGRLMAKSEMNTSMSPYVQPETGNRMPATGMDTWQPAPARWPAGPAPCDRYDFGAGCAPLLARRPWPPALDR